MSSKSHSNSFTFPYTTIRNISFPASKTQGCEIYCGFAPGKSFLDLPNDENVREWITEAKGKLRKASTQVNRAMAETLEKEPELFPFLNTGITIVGSSVKVDDKSRVLYIEKPSIINGAQTQGELNAYFNKSGNGDDLPFPVQTSFELLITKDTDLIAEVAIARNLQNNVMAISIAGKREQLKVLNERFKEKFPELSLRQSETDRSDEYAPTEKLLQVVTALTPSELWYIKGETENPNKVFTYSQRAKCLKLFTDIVSAQKEGGNEKGKNLLDFYYDVIGDGWELYTRWRSHQGFKGTGLGCIKRNADRSIKEVPDGIIFPILASLSVFAKKVNGKWKIKPPKEFDEKNLIQVAKTVLMESAGSNPNTMGKNKACYTQLHQITSIYKKLLDK